MTTQERPETVTVERKKCTRCHQTKSWTLFSRSKHSNSGLQSWCRSCHAKHDRDKRDADRALMMRVQNEVQESPEEPPFVPMEIFARLFGAQEAPPQSDPRWELARHILDLQAEVLRELIR